MNGVALEVRDAIIRRQFHMIEWNIQARARACGACHALFEDKQAFHTLLFDRHRDYERLDVCEKCWESQYNQGAADRKGFVSHWQSLYNVPPPAPPDPIQKETAESLLRKLEGGNDHEAVRYILAVMLERKRILKIKGQITENQRRVFVYEHARTGDVFTIPDPNLQLDRLEAVQRDVARMLEAGAPSTAPPDDPTRGAEASLPAEIPGSAPA